MKVRHPRSLKARCRRRRVNDAFKWYDLEELGLLLLLDLAYEPPAELVRKAIDMFPPVAADCGYGSDSKANVA